MEFVPIRIKTLVPNSQVLFDIYIQLGERYVHYISKQDEFDGARIEKLKAKGVKKLYIPTEAEESYLEYLDQGLEGLGSQEVSSEDKGALANDTLVTAAEIGERMIESQIKFTKTGENVGKIIDYLTNENEALKNILKASDVHPDNAQHCATVASLSMGLAMKLGIEEKEHLSNLGLGALLHDIGLKKIEDLDPNMNPEELETEALKKYKEHPKLGMEMLAEKSFVNQTIMDLVYNHEERGEGAGFPEKKNVKSLPDLCQILNLCNEYDRFCRTSQKEHQSASQDFFTEKLGLFDLNHMNKFKELIKETN